MIFSAALLLDSEMLLRERFTRHICLSHRRTPCARFSLRSSDHHRSQLVNAPLVSLDLLIVESHCSTILVEPNCRATVTDCGDIRITIEQNKDDAGSTELDLIRLSIFQHRFMSIAEQCGRSVIASNSCFD